MNTNDMEAQDCLLTSHAHECEGKHVPLLEIRVFGGFSATLDGQPVDSRCTRQRRVQALMSILALSHGQDLYSDYLADSIWPRSTPEKKRRCFYNLWYIATHAVHEGRREDNPYFERHHRTCCLLDAHVATDVQEVEDACGQLNRSDLEPVGAMQAYQRLQAAYRGDLLPGELENPIILRARKDWRERVCGALSSAAQRMMEQGEDRTALWFATAACRLSGMREDVVRLRMELFSRMGMQAYAVRAYTELEDYLRNEVGMPPSPQSVQMMQQVVDSGKLGITFAPSPSSSPTRRRNPTRSREAGGARKAESETKRRHMASVAFGDAFPSQSTFIPFP
jgi:DNA-binding SARP family transcriptional activator